MYRVLLVMRDMGKTDVLPDDEHCVCGYLVKHYVMTPPTDLDLQIGWDNGIRVESDVVERDCPHRNGTVIEHCPKCDHRVGMWGMGPAGSMECSCWDDPRPWWKRLLRRT